MEEANILWDACLTSIKDQISEAVWLTSFKDIEPKKVEDQTLFVQVSSSVVKDRIESRYMDLIESAIQDAGMNGLRLHISVKQYPSTPEISIETTYASPEIKPQQVSHQNVITESESSGGNPKYTFGNFVVGTSNRFAHAAALAVAETPGRSYNPLFIYGSAGLGKTHLLQGISHYVHEHYPTYIVRYVSSEHFLNEYVDAIRNEGMPAFKRTYREIDVLLIDDIQILEKKEGLQEELFHTFNTLHQANKQIILSSDRPPDAISTLEDRLRSRFKMGLITEINPPDLETRLAILRKKNESETIPISDGVMEFIATHVKNNIRELEGAFIRVCAYASLTKEQMSTQLAERVLADLLGDHESRTITPELILDKTVEMFGFTIDEIIGKSRNRPLVTARQISMYVFREVTDLSFPQIAKIFGGRDHTTVIHAVEKISSLMKERRLIYDQVTEMVQKVKKNE